MDVLPRVLRSPTPVVVPGEVKDGVVAETGEHPTGIERGRVAGHGAPADACGRGVPGAGR